MAAGRAGFHAAFPMGSVQSSSMPGSGLAQPLWHEGRGWKHPCAGSWCWEKEEHVPVVSLWISSLSACGSGSSLPVDLALLPTGLTCLHGSDSLLLVDITPPHGSDPSLWIQPLSLCICSSLPQIPSRGPCGGWQPAPLRAKGTSRYSMRDSGGICVTLEQRSERSVAGRSAGSWAAGISLPARESGSLPPWESPVGLVPCTSASPSLGISGAAPGPELCVSHAIRGVLGAGIPTPVQRAGMGGPNPRGI